MQELPLWPPTAALVFGLVGYAIMWLWSRGLDPEEEAARLNHRPAE